jgi:hypothetical protein
MNNELRIERKRLIFKGFELMFFGLGFLLAGFIVTNFKDENVPWWISGSGYLILITGALIVTQTTISILQLWLLSLLNYLKSWKKI